MAWVMPSSGGESWRGGECGGRDMQRLFVALSFFFLRHEMMHGGALWIGPGLAWTELSPFAIFYSLRRYLSCRHVPLVASLAMHR